MTMMKRRKTPILTIAVLILTGLIWTGCVQKDFHYQPSDSNHGIWDISTWGFIEQESSLSILKEAIELAGLKDLFDEEGEDKTYVLPNDKAFGDFLRSNRYGNITEVPVPLLTHWLKYFVVNDRVIFTDSALSESNNPIPYETMNGQIMYLSHNTNFIGVVNEETGKSFEIFTSNIQSTSGVIHVTSSFVYFSLSPGNLQVDPDGNGAPLTLKENSGLTVDKGGAAVLSSSVLSVTGASPENIIYSVEEAPEHGWLLINGTKSLMEGDRFTQNDIDLKNVAYVLDENAAKDRITFSVMSSQGASLPDFDMEVN